MVLYEVFSHSVKKRYLTSLFSKGSIVQLISIVLTLLSPFLIAYFTGGFWIKNKFYVEQPRVNYQYRFIALLESSDSLYVASSFDNINQIYTNEYRPSIRSVNEVDLDNNGYKESLDMTISINGIDTTTMVIQSVKLILLLNVNLTSYAQVNMETLGYFESSNSLSASELRYSGSLEFFQQGNFQDKVSYNEYSITPLNQTSLDLDRLNIANIVKQYGDRTYGTRLRTEQVSWGNSNANGFNIHVYIRYSNFQVNYIPGFWENFKWGWIQYISILIPFLWIFRAAKVFIYENQLVPTIVRMPNEKVKSL